jgi:hypothetical protein
MPAHRPPHAEPTTRERLSLVVKISLTSLRVIRELDRIAKLRSHLERRLISRFALCKPKMLCCYLQLNSNQLGPSTPQLMDFCKRVELFD